MNKSQSNGVLVVRATHEYVPVNNDELHIHAGDVITITNPEEGGWWEGTLGSKTGWFPSNYVVAVGDQQNNQQPEAQSPEDYKHTIVMELVESEGRFVAEMEEFLDSALLAILSGKVNTSNALPGTEVSLISSLRSTYSSILSTHNTHILTPLKSHVTSPQHQQLRVGRVMLTAAPHVQAAHTAYCQLHPKFVSLIERHQEVLTSHQQDGVLRVITSLSAPFRRIRAYGGLLNELECHVETFHGDRGDLQRSVAVYRELEKSLDNLRKQKEMELEVLVPGAIRDYEGTEISCLGEIMLMNLVYVGEHKLARYFVLFPNTIVILAYDSVDNQFSYHGRICVSGVTVASLPDGEYQQPQGTTTTGFPVTNAFEIYGPTIHPLVAQCPTPSIKSNWISTLTDLIRTTRCYSNVLPPPPSSQQQPMFQAPSPQQQPQTIVTMKPLVGAPLAPPVQAWNITRLRPSPPFNPFLAEYRVGSTQKKLSSSLSATRSSSSTNFHTASTTSSSSSSNSINAKSKSGSFSGPIMMMGGGGNSVTNEDDFAVLSIVDGFCGGGGGGNIINNNLLRQNSSQVVVVQRRNNSNGRVPPQSNNSCENKEEVQSVSETRKHTHFQKSLSTGTEHNNNNNNNSSSKMTPQPSKDKKKKYSWCCGGDQQQQQNNNFGTTTHNHAESLPQLVLLLRDDISVLHDRISQLTRQLEDETTARLQLMKTLQANNTSS